MTGWAHTGYFRCEYSPAPRSASPNKIAIIDIQQSIARTQEGQKLIEDLQKKYQPTKDKLDKDRFRRDFTQVQVGELRVRIAELLGLEEHLARHVIELLVMDQDLLELDLRALVKGLTNKIG